MPPKQPGPGDPDEIEILGVEGMKNGAAVDGADEVEILFEERADAAAEPQMREVREDLASRERLLRLQADFDNLTKRIAREQAEFRSAATSRVVAALLPVLDNFERAIASERAGGDDGTFRAGIALIHRQLVEVLRHEGLRPIDSLGQPFDPTIHEAVATDSTSGLPPNTVIGEIRRGYFLHQRLLRPALVTVSVSADAAGDDAGPREGQ